MSSRRQIPPSLTRCASPSSPGGQVVGRELQVWRIDTVADGNGRVQVGWEQYLEFNWSKKAAPGPPSRPAVLSTSTLV